MKLEHKENFEYGFVGYIFFSIIFYFSKSGYDLK